MKKILALVLIASVGFSANIAVKDGLSATKYLKADGAGSDVDPFIKQVAVSNTVTITGGVTNTITGVDYVSGNSGVDRVTEALETIDYAHHEIHSGSHYYIQGYLELSEGETNCVKFVTPDTTKWSHFVYDVKSTGIMTSTFDEDATGGMTGGAGITPLNNNRNSTNESGMVFTAGVTPCTGYTTRLENDKWGADGFRESIGGGSGREDELVLKQNTVYCRTFVSGADDNIVQFKASWYEHTNKN